MVCLGQVASTRETLCRSMITLLGRRTCRRSFALTIQIDPWEELRANCPEQRDPREVRGRLGQILGWFFFFVAGDEYSLGGSLLPPPRLTISATAVNSLLNWVLDRWLVYFLSAYVHCRVSVAGITTHALRSRNLKKKKVLGDQPQDTLVLKRKSWEPEIIRPRVLADDKL